jgi:predicted nucleic acid-binding protein
MSGNNILLDTNIIILLSQRKISEGKVFESYKNYYISIITYMELLSYNFKNKDEEEFIKKVINKIPIINIDIKIANRVIKLKKERKIKLPDAIIIATSIERNLLLYTYDKHILNLDFLEAKEI